MIATIPFCLTENLAPKEVGDLLQAAEEEHRPVEDLLVFAIREFLVARSAAKSATEAQVVTPAMAA